MYYYFTCWVMFYRWQILYDDHNTGWATRSDIFECTEIPRSHNILARKDEDSDYQSAVVHDSPDGGFKYNISFLDDSQTPEVVWYEISIRIL